MDFSPGVRPFPDRQMVYFAILGLRLSQLLPPLTATMDGRLRLRLLRRSYHLFRVDPRRSLGAKPCKIEER